LKYLNTKKIKKIILFTFAVSGRGQNS